MKAFSKRTISAALAALLAATAAMTASCGSTENGGDTTAPNTVTTDAPENTDPRNISRELPARNFGNATFTILVR